MCRSIIVLCLLPMAACAGEWTCWRGPTGQGISDEKNLPTKWNKDGTNVLWKSKLPGSEGKNRQDQNQSSPIIVKNRVIITASYWREGVEPTKEPPEHHVACYDFADGKLLWDVTVKPGPWKFGDLRGGYTAPTPASDGERIFVVFGSSVIAALDFDGKELWRRDIVPFDFDVAIGFSPVIVDETIVLQCDGTKKSSRLIAFDRKTGEVRWEKKRPQNDFSHSTPTLVKIGDREQLLVAASNALQGVDPTNGDVLWSCASRGDTVSPVMSNGIVYIDSGRGGSGIGVDPTGQGDVTKSHIKWKINQVPEGYSSPIIAGEMLYRLHNPSTISCRSLIDGATIFSERLQDVSTTASPFVTADGNLYLASAGKTYIVKVGPKLEVVATNDLGDSSPASPAVGHGRIVLKGRQYLYCIGIK